MRKAAPARLQSDPGTPSLLGTQLKSVDALFQTLGKSGAGRTRTDTAALPKPPVLPGGLPLGNSPRPGPAGSERLIPGDVRFPFAVPLLPGPRAPRCLPRPPRTRRPPRSPDPTWPRRRRRCDNGAGPPLSAAWARRRARTPQHGARGNKLSNLFVRKPALVIQR